MNNSHDKSKRPEKMEGKKVWRKRGGDAPKMKLRSGRLFVGSERKQPFLESLRRLEHNEVLVPVGGLQHDTGVERGRERSQLKNSRIRSVPFYCFFAVSLPLPLVVVLEKQVNWVEEAERRKLPTHLRKKVKITVKLWAQEGVEWGRTDKEAEFFLCFVELHLRNEGKRRKGKRAKKEESNFCPHLIVSPSFCLARQARSYGRGREVEGRGRTKRREGVEIVINCEIAQQCLLPLSLTGDGTMKLIILKNVTFLGREGRTEGEERTEGKRPTHPFIHDWENFFVSAGVLWRRRMGRGKASQADRQTLLLLLLLSYPFSKKQQNITKIGQKNRKKSHKFDWTKKGREKKRIITHSKGKEERKRMRKQRKP